MTEVNKEENLTPEEEIQEEEKVIKFSKTEEKEIRTEIMSKYGLDEEVDKDLIDNLTKDSLTDRKSFGKLVGQKRRTREERDALKKPEVESKKEPTKGDEKFGKDEVEKLLSERDFKRDLESLDVSDELRKEVDSYAKLNKCSPKEALKSTYITFLKGEEDKKRQEEEASAGGVRRTRPGKSGKELTPETMKADDFDLSTEEGRKGYEDWKKEHGMV